MLRVVAALALMVWLIVSPAPQGIDGRTVLAALLILSFVAVPGVTFTKKDRG